MQFPPQGHQPQRPHPLRGERVTSLSRPCTVPLDLKYLNDSPVSSSDILWQSPVVSEAKHLTMSLVVPTNFQHILRVLNTNIEGKTSVMFALTSIKVRIFRDPSWPDPKLPHSSSSTRLGPCPRWRFMLWDWTTFLSYGPPLNCGPGSRRTVTKYPSGIFALDSHRSILDPFSAGDGQHLGQQAAWGPREAQEDPRPQGSPSLLGPQGEQSSLGSVFLMIMSWKLASPTDSLQATLCLSWANSGLAEQRNSHSNPGPIHGAGFSHGCLHNLFLHLLNIFKI